MIVSRASPFALLRFGFLGGTASANDSFNSLLTWLRLSSVAWQR